MNNIYILFLLFTFFIKSPLAYHPKYYNPDSTQFHLKKVYESLIKEDSLLKIDSLLKEIKLLKINTKTYNKWKHYYNIHLRYQELEKISLNIHPKKVLYYKKLKKIYLDFSISFRIFHRKKWRLKNKRLN